MPPDPISDALVPVASLLPQSPRRWIFRQCRKGRIPGVRKIGREWFVTVEAFRAWVVVNSAQSNVLDELRAAGFR